MEMILDGVRMLDFSRYGAGPYCGMILADMGAEVIRVEKLGGEEDRKLGPFAPNGVSIPFTIILGRNKKGITLNMRKEKGKGILKKLIKHCDVVLHNFTAGAEEASLLSYDSLKEVNPAIIVASLSGFGNTGPYTQRPSFDSVAQAMSGAMSYTGFPGNPPTRGAPAYIDFGTGTYAALSIVLALYHRQRTGKGQGVDLALLDTAVSFVASIGCPAEVKLLDFVRSQIGNHSYYNLSDLFKTRDGWVMVSVIGTPLFKRLSKMIGREELGNDPRFADDMARFQNRHLLDPVIAQWMEQRTSEEVMRLLEEARVPCGQVNNMAEMMADPQVKAREMVVDVEYPEVGKVPLPGIVPKFSQTPGRIQRRAPMVGEHNSEIFCGLLGLSTEELSRLEAEGII